MNNPTMGKWSRMELDIYIDLNDVSMSPKRASKNHQYTYILRTISIESSTELAVLKGQS
jgi:hypothetical protein